MLELRGAPALSAFRRDRLIQRIQQDFPCIESLYAEFMHFVDAPAELDEASLDVLNRLLNYGPRVPVEPAGGILFRCAQAGHNLALVKQGHRHTAQLRP